VRTAHRVDLLDENGEPIEVVSGFLRFLAARDCSPNTLVSYTSDCVICGGSSTVTA
jgi:hypothetical protein